MTARSLVLAVLPSVVPWGSSCAQEANPVQVPANSKWKLHAAEWPAKDAVRVTVQILMVGAGELWVDGVVLTITP